MKIWFWFISCSFKLHNDKNKKLKFLLRRLIIFKCLQNPKVLFNKALIFVYLSFVCYSFTNRDLFPQTQHLICETYTWVSALPRQENGTGLFRNRLPPQTLFHGVAGEDATSDEERMVICEEEGDDDVMGKLRFRTETSSLLWWFQFSWWTGSSERLAGAGVLLRTTSAWLQPDNKNNCIHSVVKVAGVRCGFSVLSSSSCKKTRNWTSDELKVSQSVEAKSRNNRN